jgi:drug/metabolite transporter (DMT)-like permease
VCRCQRRNYDLLLLALAARFPSVAFICAAPVVYVRLDRWAGVPNLATVVVYSFIVLFSSTVQVLLLRWVNQPEQARRKIRWRVPTMCLVLATMITLFFLATGDRTEPVNFDISYATSPLIAGFLAVYLLPSPARCWA